MICITAIIYIILADVLIFRNNSSSIDYFKSTILVNISSINTTYIQLNITTPPDIHLKQKSQIRHVRKNAIVHGIPAICKLLPLKTCMLIHHKTGHDLSWSIRDVFEKYCHKKNFIFSMFSIKKLLSYCDINGSNPYMHWVRHPLNTIISGYYYHIKTDEEWVYLWSIKTSVNTALLMKSDLLYNDILNNSVDIRNFYSKYRNLKQEIAKLKFPKKRKIKLSKGKGTNRQLLADIRVKNRPNIGKKIIKRKTYKKNYQKGAKGRFHIVKHRGIQRDPRLNQPKLLSCFNIDEKSILYKYIYKFLDNNININTAYILLNNSNMTLQEYYRKLQRLDYRIGLFWEFIRYFQCEWPSIYVSQGIGNIYYSNNNRGVEYDIDEIIHGGFDYNMNKMLDQLGIINDDINREKLHVDGNIIDEQRMKLLSHLNDLDLSKSNKTKNNHVIMHVTHNEYNKQQVINDLLGLDVQICQLIKNMTLLLKFVWDYDKYC